MDFPDKPHLVGFVKKHLISKSKSCLKDTFNFFYIYNQSIAERHKYSSVQFPSEN